MGFWDDLKKAAQEFGDTVAETMSDGAEAASEAAEESAETVGEGAREVADALGDQARRAAGAVAEIVGVLATEGAAVWAAVSAGAAAFSEHAGRAARETGAYQERLITEAEEVFARQVFGDTLPYGAIWLSNGLGFEQRAYTIPHPRYLGSYVVHIGPGAFDDPTSDENAALFIHELTHVWQGRWRRNVFDYMVDSVASQFRQGQDAYVYVPGRPWGDYNAEQQASIVQDWFSGGMDEKDPLFVYIAANIRTGTP
ncbi:MAG TPA: hypothetical protein VHG91_07005 [Longimicrobium sp.]|nr:hypothetical protein [Longimicrobium sp.]